ncbi:YibE/F family protein, partial [Paenarthrobacter sp. RAF9]
MGHSHSHGHPEGSEPTPQAVASRKRANLLLAAVLVPLGVLTLVAMVLMWPSGSREGINFSSPYQAAPGVTFDTGKIQSVVVESCTQTGQSDTGQPTTGQPTTGQNQARGSQCTFAFTVPDKGGEAVKVVINPDVAMSHGVDVGDSIRYLNLSGVQGNTAGSGAPSYVFVDFVRNIPIAALAVLYAVVVIAVARWRGFRALLG